MTRSDLPHLARMSPENQERLVNAVWAAWRKAEPDTFPSMPSDSLLTVRAHVAYVASCAEMVEAVLSELEALPA